MDTMKAVTLSKEVLAISKQAADNEIFGAICYKFAQRERSRGIVTVKALKASMEKEGVDFPIDEYRKALEFFASLGLGRIVKDRKNRVAALADIKVTLKSIGEASGLRTLKLDYWKPKPTYTPLITNEAPKPEIKIAPATTPEKYEVTMIVNIQGEPVTFKCGTVTPGQLGSFVKSVMSLTKASK